MLKQVEKNMNIRLPGKRALEQAFCPGFKQQNNLELINSNIMQAEWWKTMGNMQVVPLGKHTISY